MSTAKNPGRRISGPRILGALAIAIFCVLATSGPASASNGSRDDAIVLLDKTRASVDSTLKLLKAGDATTALEEARSGYLSHFEEVEIPLRIADNKPGW